MLRIIFSLIISILCFYYGILYRSAIIITIGYAILLLMGFCVLEVLYRRFTTKCQLEIPLTMVEQDKPIPLVCNVANRSFFSSGQLDIQIGIKSLLANKKTKQWLTIPQVGAGTNRYDFEIVVHGAGRYDIEISKVRMHATFGLFSMKKKGKGNGSVLILPQMHSIIMETTEATRNFMGDADVYDEFRPGHDAGETFEIREYREKDKLQSIHWKLSAKVNDLVVKENSLPKACAIVLLLERKNISHKQEEEYAAAYLELIASLSFGLLDRKVPHFVAWMSDETGDVRRIRVDDEESFYLFMTYYLNDNIAVSDEDLRDVYREKYKNEIYLKDICANNHLEVYQDGELLNKLDVKKIKDECETLELLL